LGQDGDYIGAYTHIEPIEARRAALVLVDMQYATGSRRGALGRRHLDDPATRAALAYRFDRIESTVVPNQRRLIAACRDAGARVVYIRNGSRRPDAADAPAHMRALYRDLACHVGSPEHRILDEVAPEDGDLVLDKSTIGAFASTGIDSALRALSVSQLVVTGISTNMCVETTAREAADRGYAVTLVEDACATTHAELHASTLRNFARLFGRVRVTDDVLAELAAQRGDHR
jgi:nicotinamidase-related amidase